MTCIQYIIVFIGLTCISGARWRLGISFWRCLRWTCPSPSLCISGDGIRRPPLSMPASSTRSSCAHLSRCFRNTYQGSQRSSFSSSPSTMTSSFPHPVPSELPPRIHSFHRLHLDSNTVRHCRPLQSTSFQTSTCSPQSMKPVPVSWRIRLPWRNCKIGSEDKRTRLVGCKSAAYISRLTHARIIHIYNAFCEK